ncbi:MAG TPA: UDP-glucose/GDP-mannose dehydrogenase family protein [Candidatus Limnocylindrales bacterium]|nr:UDP-glucose/GDP-mannose dehydrogenase family protein [Candidatus Limnocylindrales bacterium]
MHLFLIGAGHVGLVTAVGLARLGHRLTVADIDETRIAGLAKGVPPVFEPGLEEAIAQAAAAGLLTFTTDLTPPTDCAFSIVTVSTPTGPDGPLSTANVERVVATLVEKTGPEHTIVVRSTLPVDGPARLLAIGATRPDRPAIVTNPEFMREGSALADFDRPDRLVVGWIEPRDEAAAKAVLDLYAGIVAPTLVADARSVALIKLATNVFLAAKVAYANELARICDVIGADVDTVADGIGLDPRIGRSFLTAGPGYGGSCLPEQAIALSLITAARGIPTPLIEAVSRSNETHQRAIVARLGALLGNGDDRAPAGGSGRGLAGARIALLGLAFKANTDDVRESPALSLARYVREAGATVVGTDPRAIAKARRADPELMTADTVVDAVAGADAVLVATEWPEFADLDWTDLAARMAGELVYDTRDILPADRVMAAGLRYVSLGRG